VTPEQTKLRSRIAVCTRLGDAVGAAEARRDLKAVNLEIHIRDLVATAPPLTREQRQHLIRLLGGWA
jgi:hypothetical protein